MLSQTGKRIGAKKCPRGSSTLLTAHRYQKRVAISLLVEYINYIGNMYICMSYLMLEQITHYLYTCHPPL